jgi:hypothetical protein
MSFQSFLQNLLPSFKRDRLKTDAQNIRNQLNTVVLPSLASAVTGFKKPLVSEQGLILTKIYDIVVPKRNNSNSIVFDINDRMLKIPKLLDAIDKQIAEGFTDDVVSSGLTLRKANVIRALEVLGFINKFTMSLINAIAHYEILAKGITVDYVSDVTPGELKRLIKYMNDYSHVLSSITSLKEYEKIFDHIPESKVEDDGFRSLITQSEFDPMRIFTLSQFKGNPIYSIMMMVAEWQMSNYKQMQDQKKLLEIRLVQLHRIQENRPSPELEREIKVLSSRVANLAADIRKREESFA